MVFVEKVHDDLFAVRELGVYRGKLQQHGGVVKNVCFKDLAVIFKKRQFRGSGAGVDNENLIVFHRAEVPP